MKQFFLNGITGIALCASTLFMLPVKSALAQSNSDGLLAAYTVKGNDQRAIVRVLTRASLCPVVGWDAQSFAQMTVRSAPATEAMRGDGAQTDSKPAVFDVLTCEALWPNGVKQARIEQKVLNAPSPDIKRIVILADTGCRMKGSENAFQACNDPVAWPFANVIEQAAKFKPDLVLHIGDIHYRESPCPVGHQGCAGSPWGYGYDVWEADFFKPAAPLLALAPWVFVRGNHESCFRAGQGWFRFFDQQPWSQARSCNDPSKDTDADFTEPYAVPLNAQAQMLVFDSSKTSGKPYSSADPAYQMYAAQLKALDQLAQQKSHNLFTSHHPLLAYAPVSGAGNVKAGGSGGLQSAFASVNPDRLFPQAVDVTMHGHIHLFESLSFKSNHPHSLIMGNSGSLNEGSAPSKRPDVPVYKNAEVEDYAVHSGYGFAVMDLVGNPSDKHWNLTEYNALGTPVIRCNMVDGKSKCVSL
jgi:hypothetical protein